MDLHNNIKMEQLSGLLSSPAISANATSNFTTKTNATTKGVDISFALVDITGIRSVTLSRNYVNDIKVSTVLNTWDAMPLAYTWSDTDSALQTSEAAYYWLTLSPTGTTGSAVIIGPQHIYLNPKTVAPVEAADISASSAAAKNGTVLVTVNVSGVPGTGSIKIYVSGYEGNANPVAVADQTSSPLQFTLKATSETVTLKAIGVSAGGSESAAGPTTTLTLNGIATVPAKLMGVSVAQIPSGSQITFEANLDDVTSYEIYRGTRGDPFGSATLLHTITSSNVGTIQYLDAGGFSGDYEYFIVAVNSVGSSSPSDAASVNFISATSVLYEDGVAVAALKPAAPNADVTAQQPIVYTGLSSNLVPNGAFILGNIDGWLGNGVYDSFGGGVIDIPSLNGTGISPSFNITPGQKYRITFRGWEGGGTHLVTLRIAWSATYASNIIPVNSPVSNNYNFLYQGSLGGVPNTSFIYEWVAPADMHYASLAVYQEGTAGLAFNGVAVQDYVAANEWGADKTGNQTAANSRAVGSLPASDIVGTINPGGGIDFNNAGNTNQGDLSKIDQANTINIVAGAVNSNIVYQSTVVQNVPANAVAVIAQATISTNGGYVTIRASMMLFGGSSTNYAYPQIVMHKGGSSGTQLVFCGNVFVPLSITPGGGASCVTLEAVDNSPSASQQYTITAFSNSQAIQINPISLVLENAKV